MMNIFGSDLFMTSYMVDEVALCKSKRQKMQFLNIHACQQLKSQIRRPARHLRPNKLNMLELASLVLQILCYD